MSAETAVTHPSSNAVAHQSAASQAFDLLQREGKMLASTQLVPETYRGKVADCAIIVEIAHRIGASPLLVANNLDIIYGRPSWRSQFLIATVNTCGRFSTLRYEFRGEVGTKDRACRAWAIERETQQRLDGSWIDWKMIDAEGWSTKKGSKWLTMAEQMFIYRAAAFWTRAYAPEIAMGIPMRDEVEDMIDVTPPRADSATIASINERIAARAGHTIEGEQTTDEVSTTGTATTGSTDLAGTPVSTGKTEGTKAGPTAAEVGDLIVRAKSADDVDGALALIPPQWDEAIRKQLIAEADHCKAALGK